MALGHGHLLSDTVLSCVASLLFLSSLNSGGRIVSMIVSVKFRLLWLTISLLIIRQQ
jgi:hypothetical protein